MRAGSLDRLISIDYRHVEPDATYGTDVVTWLRLVQCRAEIQDALPSRSEAVRQGLASARNQTRCRMRWRGDIESSMRVTVHGDGGNDVVYQIVGGPAEILGRKRGLELILERYSS